MTNREILDRLSAIVAEAEKNFSVSPEHAKTIHDLGALFCDIRDDATPVVTGHPPFQVLYVPKDSQVMMLVTGAATPKLGAKNS